MNIREGVERRRSSTGIEGSSANGEIDFLRRFGR